MQIRLLLRLTLLVLVSMGTASGADALFPLMAWNSAPSDAATFQKMRECGLTVAGFVSPKELDLCHAAGLKAIVSDRRVSGYDWRNVDAAVARKNLAELVAETGKHPAVYGYYLRDEPGADAFAGLAAVAAIVRELAPGKWPYINLFPNYANAQQLGAATYEQHLEKFVATCQPTQLSYDHYALFESHADSSAANIEHPTPNTERRTRRDPVGCWCLGKGACRARQLRSMFGVRCWAFGVRFCPSDQDLPD